MRTVFRTGIQRVAFAIDRARKLAQHLINISRSSMRVLLADKFEAAVFFIINS